MNPKLPILMDERCPKGLKTVNDVPRPYCDLAVATLHSLREGKKNPEIKCEWFVKDEDARYCFFLYMAQNAGQSHETIEIAELLQDTQASAYTTLCKALEKLKVAGMGDVLLGEEG